MRLVRDHVVLCFLATVAVTVALFLVGLGTDPWLQLVVPVLVAVVCTRLLAPVYFGWREPGEIRRPGRQR
jgi:membrane protein implicated in regulation of membrane protease activity